MESSLSAQLSEGEGEGTAKVLRAQEDALQIALAAKAHA
jgi:hypothetical protein